MRRIALIVLMALVAVTAVVGLSALAGPANAANGTTVIDDCTVIDEPGSYRLGGNISDVNSSQLFGSSFQSNSDACIDIRSSDVTLDGDGSLLDWDHTENTVDQRGVYVNGTYDRRSNVTVRNLEVTDWPRGVSSFNASGLLVEDTTIRTRNASDTRGWFGLYPRGTTDSTFRLITFEDYGSAIQSEGSDSATLNRNNRYANNALRGIGDVNIGSGSDDVTFTDNELRYDVDTGSFTNFITADGGTVSDNLIVGSGTLALRGSNVTVERNTIRNASGSGEYGIDVEGEGFSIRNNTVANGTRGLQIKGSDHVLRDNELRDNAENFHLVRRYTDLRTVRYSDLVSLDIDTSNTADGDPIHVFQEETDTTFTGSDVGYLAYVNSSGVTVRDVTLTNNTDGLFLANVTDATIEGTTLKENAIGMEMAGGDNVTIRRNQVSNNTDDGVVGFPARTDPTNVTVANSEVTGNGAVGVDLRGQDLTIADNDITGNGAGIDLTGDRSTVLGNDVAANDEYGIRVTADNVSIKDNGVTGNGEHGIFFDFSRDNGFEAIGNDVSNNGNSGILVDTEGGRLLDNTLIDNGESGIHIFNDGSAVIRNNTARGNTYGIRLYHDATTFGGANDNLVEDNVVTGNTYGIEAGSGAENNTIRDNVATGNGDGIYLDQVGDHRVLDNNVSANSGDGIFVDDYIGSAGTDTRIANNTAIGNGDDGIELTDAVADDSDGPIPIRNNVVRRNDHTGIVIERADGVVVANNGRVSDNDGAGIDLESSANVTVRNHTVTGNGVGFLALSSAFTVADLNASGNDGDGIRIDGTTGLHLGPDVRATDNAGNGVGIKDGRDVHIRAVPANDNGGNGIELVDPETVSIRNVTTTDNYAAGVTVVDDDLGQEGSVTVRNATVRRNGIGIDVEGVERTTITDSTIAGGNASAASTAADVDVPDDDPEDRIRVNGTGVILESAGHATIRDNEITANDGRGIAATLSANGSRIADNDVTDNGGNGIAFVETGGPSTIANNVVSNNGGLELYGTFATPNGENGVYLESSSNVTVRNNTIEGNEAHGVRINDESNDNRIAENDIAAHTSANETGHGVFILGRGVDFGFPSNNTVADNAITDNDYGVSLFHDADTVVRGNDVLRNGIGVRFGSNTEPISSRETVECTDGGVLAFNNQFAGSTDGTVVDNEIRTNGTALKIIIHPSQTTTCDGAITDIDYDDPTVEGYLIANNYINGSEPINATNSRLDYPTGETYDSSFNGTNAWNVSKTVAGNILGGPYRAGNYWATPDGTGFSQTCTDADGDGICDAPRSIATNNADQLPLVADQPAFFDVAIGATTAPGTSGDAVDVTATIANTGNATATETIDLTVNGTVAGSVSRTLDPGESTTETFTWDTTGISPGTYAATVASDTDSESVQVTIDPNVSVQIDATNAPITETETLTVDATLRNNRNAAITETIELLDFDGSVVDSRTVDLAAGASTSITLAWSTSVGDAGTGTMTVRSANDADRTEVTVRSGAISACGEITEPGTYLLESDLAFSDGPCLDVRASGVTIDGQGHALVGTGSDAGVRLNVGAGAGGDITLRNLTIREVSDAVEIPVGDGESVSGVALRNVSTTDVEENAVSARLGENGVLDGLTIEDSALRADSEGLLIEEDFEAGLAVRDLRVRDTSVIADEVGIGLDLAYDRATIDGFAVTNSTVDANDEGIELNTGAKDTTVRNVTIADNVVETGYAALFVDYGGEGATVESVRIADNRLRSDSEEGLHLEGDDTATTTRNMTVVANDIAAGSVGLDLTLDDTEVTVEALRIADNHIETPGSDGIVLRASDADVTVEAVLRNNTVTSASTGIELELGDGTSGGSAYDATVAENAITGFTDTGIDVVEARTNTTTDLSIRNNEVGNGDEVGTGIELQTEDGAAPAEGSVAVRNNSVRTSGDAVVIDGVSDRVGMVDISYNALLSAGFGVDNGASGRVNATMNYWAASDGPGSDGPYEDPLTGALADGDGSAVSNGSSASVANVRFDPFLSADPTESDDATESASFQVTIDSTNSPVEEGETLNVTATITNEGDLQGTQPISLAVGPSVDSRNLTLNSSETRSITLSWATSMGDAGNYAATVASGDDADSRNVSVLALEPANFSVAIDNTNSPVEEGETLTVSATITNEGDLQGTQPIALSTGGIPRDSANLTLNSSETRSITLSWATSMGDAGNYAATVASGDDSDSRNVSVLALEPANFSVAIDNTNSPVEEGETLTVTATITNEGDLQGTQPISLSIDGTPRDSTNLTLDGGATQTIDLSWTPASGDAGSYTVALASTNDSASTTVTVETGTGTGQPTATGTDGPATISTPGQPGFGLVVAVIALLFTLAAVRRRAR